MITLTTAEEIRIVVGSTTTVSYGKMVLDQIHLSPTQKTLTSRVLLYSTTEPEMPVVTGRLDVNTATGKMVFGLDQLDIRRTRTLGAAQKAAVQAIIDNAQDDLESGLITLGDISGTQSPGV